MNGGMMNAQAKYGMACVSCHGPEGRGGRYLAMGTVQTPDIRNATLTSTASGDAEHQHVPYTDETVLKAITEGIGSDGSPLQTFMPRWQMSSDDAEDLVEFLRSL